MTPPAYSDSKTLGSPSITATSSPLRLDVPIAATVAPWNAIAARAAVRSVAAPARTRKTSAGLAAWAKRADRWRPARTLAVDVVGLIGNHLSGLPSHPLRAATGT